MKVGKFMGKVISIGNQGFDTIREKKCFFIEKIFAWEIKRRM